jgi:hypothetical protein
MTGFFRTNCRDWSCQQTGTVPGWGRRHVVVVGLRRLVGVGVGVGAE